MPPEPIILAFDTAAAHCAAALLKGDTVCSDRTDPMQRGQAEHLMGMLEALLHTQDVTWQDLDFIAVGIGPGNFTGTRISVSAARGLSLSLNIPAIGVSMFEVMRLCGGSALASEAAEIVSLPAPRDQAYIQHFRYGKPQSAPRQIDPNAPPMDIELPVNMRVVGHLAEPIARPFHADFAEAETTDVARHIADITHWRLFHNRETPARPSPLYVRAADAAPPHEAPPVILP